MNILPKKGRKTKQKIYSRTVKTPKGLGRRRASVGAFRSGSKTQVVWAIGGKARKQR